MNTPKLLDLPCEDIRFFVQRARGKSGFEALKETMRLVGLKVPIEVRSIADLPPEQRKRPGRGHYQYELTKGQGRLTAALELGWKTIPAIVVKTGAIETVGRFLAENLVRKSRSWAERAKEIKVLVDAGKGLSDIAETLAITPGHAAKYLRIVSKTHPDLIDDVGALPLADADALTTLPSGDQLIVMDALKAAGSEREVRAIVSRAKRIAEEGKPLTMDALRKSMDAAGDELKTIRKQLQLKRLHHSLGPQNLAALMAKERFAAAFERAA